MGDVGAGDPRSLPRLPAPPVLPERRCSRALGPSAQELAYHHRAPPRLPSTPRSCCSPSPVSPEASHAKPGTARSLWGRRWHMSCLRGEECCALPWCQRRVHAGRGRDRTACAATVTHGDARLSAGKSSAMACQTGTAPGTAFPGHAVAMLREMLGFVGAIPAGRNAQIPRAELCVPAARGQRWAQGWWLPDTSG